MEKSVVVFTPGRVELLGNHTDYNEGLALAAAINLGVTVRAEKLNAEVRLRVTSNLPPGSGLYSSAAFEVATAVAALELFGLSMEPMALAQLCQKAENKFVGVRCGLLDQASSVFDKEDEVILLDFRDRLVRFPDPAKQRPVHFNSWEAVYFDHDLEALFGLVDLAAKVGAERFVLDDGWFRGRKDDSAALGDWEVDETKYPEGLQPLIDHVETAGMEFALTDVPRQE
jgi:Melibiase/GHMP kinases N terminal domain/Galactokinase galactose-binding signature